MRNVERIEGSRLLLYDKISLSKETNRHSTSVVHHCYGRRFCSVTSKIGIYSIIKFSESVRGNLLPVNWGD